MKISVLLLLLLVCGTRLLAQDDSATHYIHGLPVSEDDTVQNFPQEDRVPKSRIVVIPHAQLPEKILGTLEKKIFIGDGSNCLFIETKIQASIRSA
jgi:hypothetical protein